MSQTLVFDCTITSAFTEAYRLFEIIDRNPTRASPIVVKKYANRPDVQILNNFSLKIDVGKTYAFVGPSGCGKSTVIATII